MKNKYIQETPIKNADIEQIIKDIQFELGEQFNLAKYNIVEKYIKEAYCYGYYQGMENGE